MRGFPLMNVVAVGLFLLVLMIPLLRVDRPRPVESSDRPAGPQPQETGTPVMLLLRFVHPPLEASLKLAGQVIPLRGEGLERQGETVLPARDRSLELEFQAAWPPGTADTVVELRAAPDGLPEQQQNIWSEAAAADELLRFAWRAKP